MKKYLIIISFLAILGAGARYYFANTSASQTLITRAMYICSDNKTIDAAYYRGAVIPVKPGEPPIPTGSVSIKLSDGRNLRLLQTISADGARYANSDESFVFWSKGDGALVLEKGAEKNYTGCVVSATQ